VTPINTPHLLLLRIIVVKGYTAGPHYNVGGSGSNFLCLHETPQWKTYFDGHQYVTGSIYGAEYEAWNAGQVHPQNNVFSEENNGGNPIVNNPIPCAFCYVQGRSSVAMIPARTECPDGWTTEYAGYLVSEAHINRGRSNYICVDEAPEVAIGGKSKSQSLIYPVEVQCGTLPCQLYISGRELTCIVCSK